MMPFATRRVQRNFLDACAALDVGRLRVITPEGHRHDFGASGPEAEMRLHDWSVATAVAARGEIGFGEAYVGGLWDTPDVEAVAAMALTNLDRIRPAAQASLLAMHKQNAVHRLLRANTRSGAARNIRAHYDVGNEFYQLWLDRSMTYSGALFAPGDDLERAQMRKYDRILEGIGTAERVLEVGCGWGGFAERAVEEGRDVTAVTISPSQKGYADARLDGRAEVRLQDYRDTTGRFGALVSVEMIEAVGERYWPVYFAMLRDRLAPDGCAMIQAITVPDGHFDSYRRRSDFIRHYTFPGGMLLSQARIAEEARRAGLRVVNSFAFGSHYARTCRSWSGRLAAAAPRLRALGHGETFLRSWRYYLGISAACFATGRTDVVQAELRHA